MGQIETREDQEITWSSIRNMDQGKYKIGHHFKAHRLSARQGRIREENQDQGTPEELAKAVMQDAGVKYLK